MIIRSVVNTCRDFEHHPLAQDTSAHKGNIPYGRGWCCSIINLTLNYEENVIRSLLSRGWCNVFYRVVQLSSPRAESARAVTGRRCPHSGVGEDFLERRPGSPHENGRNSGTKSRKLDTLVPKRSQRRGLRTPL